MSLPLAQQWRIARYVLAQKLRRRRRYPLVLMLEPLFQCNLACAGCGKIDYPEDILRRRMSVDDALAAVDACGAPIVSIAGGEPLIHRDLPQIVAGILQRRRFVYLCTNALLLADRLDDYRPTPRLAFSVHLDGLAARHDAAVCRSGVFATAEKALRAARARGFRVNVNCTVFAGERAGTLAEFLDYATGLGVEGITLSPGFSYSRAPRQDHFPGRTETERLFTDLLRLGRTRTPRWPLHHSPAYLDFLAGNRRYRCSPWSTPTYNIHGWQRPCYLLAGDGYARTYPALLRETDWTRYGTGRDARCRDCMAHCGYEGSAVDDMFSHPLASIRLLARGPGRRGTGAP
jgi:hopanoid biosynthesis associated radical SAM protein HpnH